MKDLANIGSALSLVATVNAFAGFTWIAVALFVLAFLAMAAAK